MIKSCPECGYTRNTNPNASLCSPCESARRKSYYAKEWQDRLDQLGYDLIEYKDPWRGSHTSIEVRNRECDHVFVAKLNNITSRRTICGHCGPAKRAANALKHYIAKYGRTYDLTKWLDYRDYVRGLSEETYEKNIDVLNPERKKRTRADLSGAAVNLDHIIPIIYGFKNGLKPELLADVRNLRVVDARSNLQKKQRLTETAMKLLAILDVQKDSIANL